MSILIYKNDQQAGPYELSDIQQGLENGIFTLDDFAWQEGCSDWVPLQTLLPSMQAQETVQPKTLSGKIDKITQVDSVLSRFINEEQDPAVVERVVTNARELLTRGEEIEYVGVQKKPVFTIAPDAILLTNKRFIIVRPKIMGMTFQDHVWREVANVHMSEQMLSATITCTIVGGHKLSIDSIPKKQARKIYSYAQEVEERMHEVRRDREIEEKRAAAGGVVIHSPTNMPQQAALPVPDDPMVTLGKLKQLLDAGLINVSEYDIKKSEVLAKM